MPSVVLREGETTAEENDSKRSARRSQSDPGPEGAAKIDRARTQIAAMAFPDVKIAEPIARIQMG